MPVDFGDKKFRSDFKAEQTRVLNAIRDVEATETSLSQQIKDLSANMHRVRGAASLVIRLNEQLTASRNLKLSLIKELRATKKDVIDRDIKLAEKSAEADAASRMGGVSAELLSRMQMVLLAPGATVSILEPGHGSADDLIAARVGGTVASAPAETTGEEAALPEEIREGDTFSDPEGNLWVLGEDGAEQLGATAEEVFPDGAGDLPPYARLSDGRFVLVADIDADA